MPAATESKLRPEWLTETPPNHRFFLIAEDCATNTWAQDVVITRDEYETLKWRLAELRGLLEPTEKEADHA